MYVRVEVKEWLETMMLAQVPVWGWTHKIFDHADEDFPSGIF